MGIEVRTDLIVHERDGSHDGPYTHVATAYRMDGNPVERIWWDGGDGLVHETQCTGSFSVVYIDFDRTLVGTEGAPGRFFDVSWAALMREAGIAGSVEQLSDLRARVYRWRDDVGTSTRDMYERIQRGVSLDVGPLTDEEQREMGKLFDRRNLERWNDLLPQSHLGEHVASVVADRKEQLGAQILREDPTRVIEIAPFMPGASEFIRAIHPDIPIAIGSGAREETVIKPILDAHDRINPDAGLRKRFGALIFGEEHAGSFRKPHPRYFENLAINTGQALFRHGRIPEGGVPVEDMVFIGDRPDLDVSRERRMPYVVVNPPDNTPPLGRLTAVVPDFPTLLAMAYCPTSIKDPVLSRLALTLDVSDSR